MFEQPLDEKKRKEKIKTLIKVQVAIKIAFDDYESL